MLSRLGKLIVACITQRADGKDRESIAAYTTQLLTDYEQSQRQLELGYCTLLNALISTVQNSVADDTALSARLAVVSAHLSPDVTASEIDALVQLFERQTQNAPNTDTREVDSAGGAVILPLKVTREEANRAFTCNNARYPDRRTRGVSSKANAVSKLLNQKENVTVDQATKDASEALQRLVQESHSFQESLRDRLGDLRDVPTEFEFEGERAKLVDQVIALRESRRKIVDALKAAQEHFEQGKKAAEAESFNNIRLH